MRNLFIILFLAHCSINASDNFAFMLTKIEAQNEVPDIGSRGSFWRCPLICGIVCSPDLPVVDYINYGRDDYDYTSFLYGLAQSKIMYDDSPLAKVVSRERACALTKAFLNAKNLRPVPVNYFVATTHPGGTVDIGLFPLCGSFLAALDKCTACFDSMATSSISIEVGLARATMCALSLGCAFAASNACVHTCRLCDLELVQEEKCE